MNNISHIISKAWLATLAFLSSAIVVHAASAQAPGTLESPLRPEFSTVPALIGGLLQVVVKIGLPVITLFIVFAGFKFILAQGKPEGLKDAKKNFKYVMYGTVLILGAWMFSTILIGTVGQLLGKS